MLTDDSQSNGAGAIGVPLICRNCKVPFVKAHKRQFYCVPCGKLAEQEALPHQLERRRERMKLWAEKQRRTRGDRLFKGEIIACQRCSAKVPTTGIGQKFCPACQPIALAELKHKHDRLKRIRKGKILVGSLISCRNCGTEFTKIGVNQVYCSAICRSRRWSSDPAWIINRRMSAGVKSSLGDGKNGRSWELLVGYTVAELMVHLGKQFSRSMTWENRGEWHIDHIQPLSSFRFETADDPEFKAAWALSNLQPLWGRENLSKSKKRTHLL
jgi:predicted Zn-ribbon and HTH transcriptional regulator